MAINSLAHPLRATAGTCSICAAKAIGWQRSGRRNTDADGLTLAVRYCAEHEHAAEAALNALTLEDVVRLIPRARRARRRDAAIRQARRMGVIADCASRTAAEYSCGRSSSIEGRMGLVSAYRRMQGEAYGRLAQALA